MNDENVYDLIIIGGGPSGIVCGIEAQKAGLNYLILEKGVLVNSIYHFPTNMTFFSTSNLLEIGEVPFISHGDKPTRTEALEYYRRISDSWNLNIRLFQEVNNMEPVGGDTYQINTNKASFRAMSVIVATGFYGKPRMLDVPGEALPKVKHYYDDAHTYYGQDVLVVGAANSACDVALETYYKGANVTMAIRSNQIYEKVKYWIRPNIENRIKEGSVKAHFKTVVKEIKPEEVVLENADGVFTIPNDFVLAMTGYQPDYDFLTALGIKWSDDNYHTPIHDEQTLESNLPNVYLAGVVLGGLHTSKLFIENTRHHGKVIVASIKEKLLAHS